MKDIYMKKTILIVGLSLLLFSGCQQESAQSLNGENGNSSANTTTSENGNKKDNGGTFSVELALAKLAGASSFTDEMGAIRLRKTADSIYSDQEANGFLIRDDNKQMMLEQKLAAMKQMMQGYGFQVTESAPKNSSSDVVTYLRMDKDTTHCIVEYRQITSQDIPELAVGCWE